MKRILALFLSFLVASCAGGSPPASLGPAPIEIELGRGARWDGDRTGFDPALPGFHLAGDIASIRLRLSEPARTSPPPALILSIRTPGERANLEGFTFTASDTSIPLAPMPRAAFDSGMPASTRDSLLRESGQGFFRFEIRDSVVLVHFEQPALHRLREWATVSWVDWYRR